MLQILFLSIILPAFSQSLQIDFDDKQKHTVLAENVVFVGHATAFWDSNRKTEQGTRDVIKLGQDKGWYRIATAAAHMTNDPYLAGLHFFEDPDVDLIVSSQAGSHRLLFPNLKNIVFVGGNLNRCLCEGIRDVAIGLYQSSNFKEVNFILVTDGIYAAYNPYSPVREADVALDFSKNFFVPSFRCPLQNWGRATEKRFKMPGLKLNVYFGESLVGSFDTEPADKIEGENLEKNINVHFVTKDEVKSFFN